MKFSFRRLFLTTEGHLKPGYDAGFLIVAGLFPLLWVAFWNEYPLVYSDTGSYIRYGFENAVPPDRPLLYCLFLRHFSLKFSLWLVVIAQALITSSSLFIFISGFFTELKTRNLVFSITVLLLCCTTAIAQKCSNLLPDFLTPIIALLVARSLIRPIKGAKKWAFLVLLLFALSAHNSNLYILFLTLLLFLLFRSFRKSIFRQISFRTIRIMLVLSLSGFLLVGTLNWAYTGEFFVSKNAKIFMTGHLADCGLLDEFLQDKCGQKNYVLCPSAGTFKKIDFLWDEKSSPLYTTGGWKYEGAQFNEMLKDLFTDRVYLGKFISTSFHASIHQLALLKIDVAAENLPYLKGSAPAGQIEWRFPKELDNYLNSKQNRSELSYSWLNLLQWITLALSFLVIIVFFFYKKFRSELRSFYITTLIFILFIISNAVVCGTFTIANPRFGNRVIWLVPLMAILLVAEVLRLRRNTSKL